MGSRIDGGRPAAVNPVTAHSGRPTLPRAAYRRRSTLPLPAAVLCPGQSKGMDWQQRKGSAAAVNPAAALSGRPIGNTAQGSAAGRRYAGIDGGRSIR